MDPCRQKTYLRDSKDTLVGVEESWEDSVPSKGGVSSIGWLIVTVLIIMGFASMFFVVARQQIQINTMQLEVEKLLQDEINKLEFSYMEEELKDNETESEVVMSRLRRQVNNRATQDHVPFAHLVQIQNDPRRDTAFLWRRPLSSRYSTSDAYYSNVRLYPSSGGSSVKAIEVGRSGWYYVYAQVPYKHDTDVLLGHKIVKMGRCGTGPVIPVLQTLTQLRRNSEEGPDTQDWKYLGGIVHLAAGDHIEVHPVTNLPIDNDWLNKNDRESRTGGYFGLFEVQRQIPAATRNCNPY